MFMRTLSSIFRYQRSGGPTPFRVLTRNMHHKHKELEISWKKPDKGWIKLNFDGSCKWRDSTYKGSIGGVFRNHNAEFVLGYAESIIGKTNSGIAEFTALQRGLELVLENGWTHVWLEGDNKSLVEIIEQKRSAKCAQLQRHVISINSIISKLNNCRVTHIYREGNRAADKFAEIGHLMKRSQIWHQVPPEEVVPIVKDDARGKISIGKRKLDSV